MPATEIETETATVAVDRVFGTTSITIDSTLDHATAYLAPTECRGLIAALAATLPAEV